VGTLPLQQTLLSPPRHFFRPPHLQPPAHAFAPSLVAAVNRRVAIARDDVGRVLAASDVLLGLLAFEEVRDERTGLLWVLCAPRRLPFVLCSPRVE
jgi:hypothetical protein